MVVHCLLYLDLPAAERQGHFLPFNVLRQPLPPHSLASNIKEAFHRAWRAPSRGGVKVLISNELPLPDLYRLLTDKPFRERLRAKEADPYISALLPRSAQRPHAASTCRPVLMQQVIADWSLMAAPAVEQALPLQDQPFLQVAPTLDVADPSRTPSQPLGRDDLLQ